jgi:hypothetical protein
MGKNEPRERLDVLLKLDDYSATYFVNLIGSEHLPCTSTGMLMLLY